MDELSIEKAEKYIDGRETSIDVTEISIDGSETSIVCVLGVDCLLYCLQERNYIELFALLDFDNYCAKKIFLVGYKVLR